MTHTAGALRVAGQGAAFDRGPAGAPAWQAERCARFRDRTTMPSWPRSPTAHFLPARAAGVPVVYRAASPLVKRSLRWRAAA
jgi:hypothetical protein